MKRDKEWLKQKLNTEKYYRGTNEMKDKTTYGELYDRGISDGINVALEFIEQLDEPEVKQLDKKIKKLESYNDELIRDNNQLRNELDNQEVLSQEWIGEHRWNNRYIGRPFVYVDDLQNLLVSKQDKPVIPQFVADYIETYKGRGFPLGAWFEFVHDEDEFENKTEEWLYSVDTQEEMLKREYLLIDAIRYGYEVEKEKKYRVVFNSQTDDLILFQTGKNLFIGDESANDGYWKQHFTESEIKAIDKRYWVLAEEVTE